MTFHSLNSELCGLGAFAGDTPTFACGSAALGLCGESSDFSLTQIDHNSPAHAAFEDLVDLGIQTFERNFLDDARQIDAPLAGEFIPRHLARPHRDLHRVDTKQGSHRGE